MTQQKIQTGIPVPQVAAAVFVFRGTVLTKRSNFAADLDVWRNANRDLYFAARAVKHLRLEMAQLQRQYPGVQWGFFCTGMCPAMALLLRKQESFCTSKPCSGVSSAKWASSDQVGDLLLIMRTRCHAMGHLVRNCVHLSRDMFNRTVAPMQRDAIKCAS